jgi:hypothetical protein
VGFTFEGVFSTGNEAVMKDLLQHHRGVGRLISNPFVGFGVSFIDQEGEPHSQLEYGDPCSPLSQALVSWSTQFPSTRNVLVYVECFGGNCIYSGFSFADGAVLHHERIEAETGVEALRRLLAEIGVQLDPRGYFEPLSRSYFAQCAPASGSSRPHHRSWWRTVFGASRE